MASGWGRVLRWLLGRPSGVRRTLWRRWWAGVAPAPDVAPATSAQPPPNVAPAGPSYRAVLSEAQIRDGEVVEVRVEGASLAVCRVGDEVFALDSVCPHAGGPLADGEIEGHDLLCPLHGWAFDLRTGACKVDPDGPVRVYPARLRGGQVEVAWSAHVAPGEQGR